jgi:hypothetical protein
MGMANGNGLERGFRKELDKGRRGETGDKGKERKGKERAGLTHRVGTYYLSTYLPTYPFLYTVRGA